jgi:hypothetical protein
LLYCVNMSHCALCFIGATNYGEIYPGHELVFVDGHYSIVNDHDEIYRFHGMPLINIFEGKTEDEVNHAPLAETLLDDAYMAFVEKMRETFIFAPQHGHKMVELCKQVGYDPMKDGWLDFWLCNRAGRMVLPKNAS